MSFSEYCKIVARNFDALSGMEAVLQEASALWLTALKGGRKIIFCGNGGSASDSQHLAAELVGRYKKNRAALPGLALTVDTSALTAIGNDYGYDEVFARQLRGLGQQGDVLVAITTSGNSGNVLRAAEAAKEMGITVLGMTGEGGGKLTGLADLCIAVPSGETNHIQEMHIAVGHYLCGVVEDALSKG